MTTEGDGSDWEYEYSEDQTEEHFVIIDLGPSAVWRSQRFARNKEQNEASLHTESDRQSSQDDTRPQIQLLDPASPNPFLNYDSHLYSLAWESSISSTLIYDLNDPQAPLTTSALRLAATPATLVPKPTDRVRRNEAVDMSSTSHAASNIGNGKATAETTSGEMDLTFVNGRPTTIPLGPAVSETRRKQARFLERLMAVKREKGEEDEVTVFAIRRTEPRKDKSQPVGAAENEQEGVNDEQGNIEEAGTEAREEQEEDAEEMQGIEKN